ncbi:DUF1212-domain-containing protein [Sistotremastrum niveocremeum HHB9708]|uniref:DUF1212-domain-containing protein n=1 Tax=Sistotremastrum niveocremeum HHB9708 TaxID=1314777 RepID=A0A164WLN4_9AGAM|nr:DUF1212-domain-containing protein [Sistotremastrum niveocremeum HHB9708]
MSAHRRVQWDHSLDEQAKDREAFRTLTKALEEEQSKVTFFSTKKRSTSSSQEEKPEALEVIPSKDIEAAPATSTKCIPPLSSNSGVLSSLLGLYDAQHEGAGVSGIVESPSFIGTTVTETPKNHRRNSSYDTVSGFIHTSTSSAKQVATQTLKNISSPAVSAVVDRQRPAAARNGGGVFGSLIASTGNISGVAAPTASTLAPNPKRPGWHLSRFGSQLIVPSSLIDLIFLTHRYSWDGPRLSTKRQAKTPLHSLGSTNGMANARSESVWSTLDGDDSATLPHSDQSSPNSRSRSQTAAGSMRNSWAGLKDKISGIPDTPHSFGFGRSGTGTGTNTPTTDAESDDDETNEKRKRIRRDKREWKKREKRIKQEIFITRHVGEVLERQQFLMKLARALMMFGAPTHRLESQIQSTAHVLDLPRVSCIYLPSLIIISFDDPSTLTSSLKFIKQVASLDLGKLVTVHHIYWQVIHDECYLTEAGEALDTLMDKEKVLYRGWRVVAIGGLCSSFICFVSFKGSFIDSLVVFPLGCLLVAAQQWCSRNELYSNVFEIAIATLLSFICAALAATHKFCYTAIASSSVVLILPGAIVLSGSLELASKNIISGSVRMMYAVMYSLFLGFGLAIGAQIYTALTPHQVLGSEDYECSVSHYSGAPWYQANPSEYWAFLCVPMFSLFLSLRNQAPLFKKEMPITILISCAGWTANHFSTPAFKNHSDISSAVGSFVVGTLANLWGRTSWSRGNAFVVMITGIMFQLPSGLGNGGLLTFASQEQTNSTTTTGGGSSATTASYEAGFQVALQLVSVAIGLTVGLFASVVLVYPFGGGRKRAGGLFSL